MHKIIIIDNKHYVLFHHKQKSIDFFFFFVTYLFNRRHNVIAFRLWNLLRMQKKIERKLVQKWILI